MLDLSKLTLTQLCDVLQANGYNSDGIHAANVKKVYDAQVVYTIEWVDDIADESGKSNLYFWYSPSGEARCEF